MKTSEILKKLDQAWSEKLNTKTNWGINQLEKMWRETLNEVMFEYIDVE
jgi:hypothetical protein